MEFNTNDIKVAMLAAAFELTKITDTVPHADPDVALAQWLTRFVKTYEVINSTVAGKGIDELKLLIDKIKSGSQAGQ